MKTGHLASTSGHCSLELKRNSKMGYWLLILGDFDFSLNVLINVFLSKKCRLIVGKKMD